MSGEGRVDQNLEIGMGTLRARSLPATSTECGEAEPSYWSRCAYVLHFTLYRTLCICLSRITMCPSDTLWCSEHAPNASEGSEEWSKNTSAPAGYAVEDAASQQQPPNLFEITESKCADWRPDMTDVESCDLIDFARA